MIVYYEVMMCLSFLLTSIYGYIWHKRFNVNITLIFVLIPISNVGFWMLSQADNANEAILATKINYVGGCFVTLFLVFAVLGLCKIEMPKALRGAYLSAVLLIYMTVLTMDNSVLFYKSVTITETNGIMVLVKKYGIFHHVFVGMIAFSIALSILTIIYSYFCRNDVSNKILNLLILPGLLTAGSYFLSRNMKNGLNLVPLSYVITQFVFLLIVRRMNLYDISDTAIDSLTNTGTTGFISIDRKFRFLGCNKTAMSFFPQIRELAVDKPIVGCTDVGDTMIRWIKVFSEDENRSKFLFEYKEMYYQITVTHLYEGNKKRGYQLFIIDDTQNRAAEKAKHTVEMQDKLLLGMATMVESRDNSTGGHIKRSSACVRMLISEMKKESGFDLTESFCRAVIKAAPLHDLGKIAVDDAILRKPGRFTPEEYDKMKVHAAEGARMIREILSDHDDPEFREIAENVAHFHHERWDGSGYPEGLAGEEIPFEARIMAVADVYDALVSKRVYKEKMSFEEAKSIILDGMGKHFDKRLESSFIAALPTLESYYSSLEG